MSSPDRRRPLIRNGLRMAALCATVLAVTLTSACTVRPLYATSESSVGAGPGAQAGLGSIAIAQVNTRTAQEVRNHLIFMFNGGAGEPATPAYTMDLAVSVLDQAAAVIQVDDEDRPTAGTLKITARYTLKDTATGKVVITGTRDISSSYDRPSQQFAALRARRDAENRAARELASLVRLDVGQKLSTR